MSIYERARARIELDGSQADAQLETLRSKAAAMRQELNRMRLSQDPGYAQKQREFKNLNNKIRQLSRNSFNLNNILKNISGASMRDLTRAQSILTAEIRNTNRATAEGRAAFAVKTEQLRRVRTEIANVRAQMTGMNNNMNVFQRVAQGFNRYMGMITASVGAFAGVIMGLRSTVNVFNEFEASVAELQAITGLAGEELGWMAERAQQASISMTEDGIRFTNSAKEIVEAYTMVGSKRPELLQNKEALAEVTEAAMTLSSAARIDLEPAATALTTVMNQFGASASEASRIINVLGAGSKVGAANVGYLNRVIERSGTAAVSAGLSIEELVGVVEGVAPRFSQPADAATALRNVFLRLQTLDDDLNPAIVGVDKALENLANRQLSTAEITQMFGLRSVNMVMALIDGREDITRYTEAVTGTSVALEQAAINSDTNAAALEQARNRAALLRIELGEKIAPALTFSTNAFSYLLKIIKEIIDNWDKYRQLLIATIAVYVAYNQAALRAKAIMIAKTARLRAQNIALAANKAATASARSATLLYAAAQAYLTGNVGRANAALRLLRVSMMATPIGAILAGVTALSAALVIYTRRKRAQSAAEGEHSDLIKQANDNYAQQSSRIIALQQITENANLPLERRREAMERLNQIVPEYNGKLSEEGEILEANTEALKLYLDQLRQQIRIKLFQDEIEEFITKQQIAKNRIHELEQWLEDYQERVEQGSASALAGDHMKATQYAIELANLNNEVDEHQKKIESLTYTYSSFYTEQEKTSDSTETLSQAMLLLKEAQKITGTSTQELQEKIDILKTALSHTQEGSSEFNEVQKLLTFTQEQLNEVLHGGNQELVNAKNAYQELTTAISEAQRQLQHFVAIGDFDSAKSAEAVRKNLEANKLVMDGIIEAGGDVVAFLESMSDSTQAELEETLMFNEMFLDNWKESSDQFEKEQAERKEAERQMILDQEQADFKRRLEMARLEAEARMEWERQVSDLKRGLTDSLLHHSFQLHGQYLQKQFAQQTNALNLQMEAELSHEYLSEEQKDEIRLRYAEKENQLKKDQFEKQKRADVVQSIINTAVAVTRALAAPPGFPLNAPTVVLAGAMGAIQTAAIAAQPVPQYAKGKYVPVVGKDDNRQYNAQWIGKAKTGIYHNPALFAEQGEEIIIDSPTTRHLKLNHPEIIEAIMINRVPQYATGKYNSAPKVPQYADGKTPSSDLTLEQTSPEISSEEMAKLKTSIDNLYSVSSALLQEGVRGVWVYSDLMSIKNKVDSIEKASKL